MTVSASRLRRLWVFARIAQAGSITAAARGLGLSKSVVSGHLQALEAELGVRLLERSTRSMRLTQVGAEVLAAAERMLEAVEDAAEAAAAEARELRGVLRIACPSSLARGLVRPLVGALLAEHPRLSVELSSSDRTDDLIQGGFDVALRIGFPQDSGAIIRRLAEDPEIVVAGPALAARWRGARHPDELADAPWVLHRQVAADQSPFQHPDGRTQRHRPARVVLSVDSAPLLVRFVEDGVGVAALPRLLVADALAAGRLVRVLPEWQLRTVTFFALRPSRSMARRTAVFLERLVAWLPSYTRGGDLASSAP